MGLLFVAAAAIFSVLVSILLKWMPRRGIDVAQAVTWNYLCAAALCLLLLDPPLDALRAPAAPWPALLLLAVVLGSFLALRAQRSSGLGNVEAATVRHLVDVRVTPGNLPPVSLVVDRSPDGSLYSPGTIIGSVPRRVAFDANGVWVVHAQFQGRSSTSVTLRVPDESVITLDFPEPGQTAP